jgi:predicted permease
MTSRQIGRRLRALVGRDHLERELQDEMKTHLELEAQDLVRTRGLSVAEARRQAALRFGGVDRHVEAHRDVRGTRWLEDAAGDIRYATRALRRTPAFTLAAVGVLALGIGVSTTIFSAVNAVIVAHLPYADDDRLMRIYNQQGPTNRWSLSVADFQAIRDFNTTMEAVGVLSISEAPVAAGKLDPARTRTVSASSGIFTALGVRAAVGRVIQTADEDPGAPAVVVLTDAFARNAFGSGRAALGQTVQIDGQPRPVVGVLEPGVKNLGGYRGEVYPAFQPQAPRRRGPFGLVVIAKRKVGTSDAREQSDLQTVAKRVAVQWARGTVDTSMYYVHVPIRQAIIGDAPKTLWMFAGAAALLLLLSVVNVANLMLARMTARLRELSLRLTLGASRSRLTRLVLAETLLVSLVGVAIGAVAAFAMLRALVAVAGTMPRLATASIDMRAVAFASAVGILTGAVIGVSASLSLLSRDAKPGLAGATREIGGRATSRTRAILVAAEFALALPLLSGAGQLLESIGRLQEVNPGFDPDHIAYVHIVLPQAKYDTVTKVTAYWDRAAAALRATPGVVAAGYATELPPTDLGNSNNFLLEGVTLPEGAPEPVVPWLTASPGYFDALGVRLIEGRMFTPADTGPTGALIVSESFAKHYSSDRPVVGRRIFEGGCRADTCGPTYIVGVVSDIHYDGLDNSGEGAYWSSVSGMYRSGYMIVKVSGDPSASFREITQTLRGVDRDAAMDPVGSMAERVYGSTAQPRQWARLLSAFAIAALALSAVGVFGLLSYWVSQMRREIGVRVALGAQRRTIARMVVNRGLVNAAMGAVAGIVIAFAGQRLIESSLYGASGMNLGLLALAGAILLGVSAAAAAIPALRASRVDAMTALRSD